MLLLSAFILSGLIQLILAKDSCFSKNDYEFYLLQNLIEEVEQKVKFLKENVKAGENASNTTCSNMTCADGWVSYKGSCYLFDNAQARRFGEAEIFCSQFGASILHVNDLGENNFITGILKHFNKKYWWVGLTDRETEGNWKWVDTNTTAEFVAWDSGQPQGQQRENCVIFHHSVSYRWHDAPCHEMYHPICEKRLQ